MIILVAGLSLSTYVLASSRNQGKPHQAESFCNAKLTFPQPRYWLPLLKQPPLHPCETTKQIVQVLATKIQTSSFKTWTTPEMILRLGLRNHSLQFIHTQLEHVLCGMGKADLSLQPGHLVHKQNPTASVKLWNEQCGCPAWFPAWITDQGNVLSVVVCLSMSAAQYKQPKRAPLLGL